MHRFFISPAALTDHEVVIDDKVFLHQWIRVLKFHEGTEVMLCDGNENQFTAKIIELSEKKARLEITGQEKKKEIFPCDLHLYVSILNNQTRFEWMLEKCTEIGVKSFTPIIARRTQEKFLHKKERLLNIIREAAEQSGRTILPQLNEPVKLETALKQIPESEKILLGYVGKSEMLFDMKVSKHPTFHLFIGPEGDFDIEELKLFKEKNALPFSLGRQILRTETATVAATTLLLCR